MRKLKPVHRKDLNKLKKELLKKQGGVCPISLKPLELNKEAVVDHQHKSYKNQPIGEDGAGLIRGVLDFRVNAFEGRVLSWFKRCGLQNMGLYLPDVLRNLADYLENNITEYIHPAELPKPKKLMRSKFNKIAKLYKEEFPQRKQLVYPKSGKITKKIQELAIKYNVEL